MAAGSKLKTLRNRRNITVRQVEQASVRIAEAKGDKRFRISNGWLAQLENGISEPSICKLFTLSAIYHADFRELSRLYNVDIDEIEKYALIANPNLTQLCAEPSMAGADAELELREEPRTHLGSAASRATGSPSQTENARGILSGYIGLTDYTMYPLIRPGAVVEIDTNQKHLNSIPWENEFERPIFFIELRDEYACGWCELQGSQLLIIPYYPSSQVTIRSFTFRRDAEIVGRVVAYNTRCVDSIKKEKK
ncbi:MAG TPA: helix-turn-helix transcriptional regulator [Pyrinomonadaceae bacterium]|nr:helix-turn-helix transcriptional regulator [Pyrinomonadaceae bacterium]